MRSFQLLLLLTVLLDHIARTKSVLSGSPSSFSFSSSLSSPLSLGRRPRRRQTAFLHPTTTQQASARRHVSQDNPRHSAAPPHSSSTSSLFVSTFRSNNNNNNIMSSEEESAAPRPQLATLRVQGPDKKGVVAAFAQTLAGHGCSIYEAEQSTDRSVGLFFQRIRFDYTGMLTDRHTLTAGIQDVCQRLEMTFQLDWGDKPQKVAIFVSKYDHCLWELLLRHRAGELDCDISLVISNHPDLKPVADAFHVPFYEFRITKDTKQEQEAKEIELLKAKEIDLVILARYMQIVSDHFCQTFPHKVINIHHSFLPAFVGGKPYHRAHERGVKLVGATAHYATADLDEGPIIQQDTVRISHRDEVNDLLRKGRTLEKNVLVYAVQAHLENRILVYGNKCVVFGD